MTCKVAAIMFYKHASIFNCVHYEKYVIHMEVCDAFTSSHNLVNEFTRISFQGQRTIKSSVGKVKPVMQEKAEDRRIILRLLVYT